MRPLILAAALCALAGAASLGVPLSGYQQQHRERPQDRIVGDDASQYRLPPNTYTIAENLATIAKASGVLIGFETVLDLEQDPHGSQYAGSPRGKRVGEALDNLVAMDPRYEWREVGGVIHFRPREAYTVPQHFLNRMVGTFELKDAIPQHATFEVHKVYRPGCVLTHPIYTEEREQFLLELSETMRRPLTVKFRGGTVLSLLDAIVKAHGALSWSVMYKVPPERLRDAVPLYEYALFSFSEYPQVGGWWRMCIGDDQ